MPDEQIAWGLLGRLDEALRKLALEIVEARIYWDGDGWSYRYLAESGGIEGVKDDPLVLLLGGAPAALQALPFERWTLSQQDGPCYHYRAGVAQ